MNNLERGHAESIPNKNVPHVVVTQIDRNDIYVLKKILDVLEEINRKLPENN